MARKQRRFTVFSLSFLDIMSCGFGATVLVFMLIHHSTLERSDRINEDLLIEIESLTQEIEESDVHISRAKSEIEEADRDLVQLQAQVRQITEEIARARDEMANQDETTMSQRENIAALMADIKSLEDEHNRLEGAAEERKLTEADARDFLGQGDRQYLTGLRLGGRRLLIMLDMSASMLDTTVVNIIRRRNMPFERKVDSAKWQRSVRSVEWILSRLPETVDFQVYVFNDSARPLLAGTENEWYAATDKAAITKMIKALQSIDPAKGTSLYQSFNAIRSLDPMPDNVVLITDGLPTVGESPPRRRTVSPRNRLRLFNRSLEQLPIGIPINTILMPIEGDPQGAVSFWRLAMATGGSFMSPSKDWP